MKKIILISVLSIFIFSSCKSLNYMKEEDLKEIKLPFEAMDYPNTSESFYAIENAKGSNLSVLRNMVQMQAKVNLANALKFKINSITDQRQSGTQGKTTASFQQQASSVIDQSIEKMILLDSKTLRNNKSEFEFWAVFSIQINDVKHLNDKQVIFDVNQYNEVLKKNIKSDNKLFVSENTYSNEYISLEDLNNNFNESLRRKIEIESKSYIGIPYVWGGNSPQEGFDCSGYVRWVFKKSLNKLIPRTTLDQSIEYKNLIKTEIMDSKKGDLIYFKTTTERDISHVGIYLDNGKFIHAPNENEKIKIDELKGYWRENLVGYVSVINLL